MQIHIDKNNIIDGYATTGNILDSITVETIPDDFEQAFYPNKYIYADGKIQQNPNFKPPLPRDTRNRIEELKSELQQSDYKVRKCMEFSLLGLEMPYDMQKIHIESQAMRDEINILENE